MRVLTKGTSAAAALADGDGLGLAISFGSRADKLWFCTEEKFNREKKTFSFFQSTEKETFPFEEALSL